MTKQTVRDGDTFLSQAYLEAMNTGHPGVPMLMAPARCGASGVLVTLPDLLRKIGKQHSKGYRKPTPWPSR